MAVSLAAGASQLVQIGVSISDIALLVQQGRNFGNWFRVAANDEELLATLREDPDVLLRRRGVVDAIYMSRRWKRIEFLYQGIYHSNRDVDITGQQLGLTAFSWLMIAILGALDLCLPTNLIKSLLIDVITSAGSMGKKDERTESLRALLSTNIESWRSTGAVRDLSGTIRGIVRNARSELLTTSGGQRITIIPQLNFTKRIEMQRFLIWLLAGTAVNFVATSATVFATAVALEQVGIRIRTSGGRRYETEPQVYYHYDSSSSLADFDSKAPHKTVRGARAQQVSYPIGDPSAMIQAVPADRQTLNEMELLWSMGAKAADDFALVPEQLVDCFDPMEADVYYSLETEAYTRRRFSPGIMMHCSNAFSKNTDAILAGFERMASKRKDEDIVWLQRHTQLEYLQNTTEIIKEADTRRPLLLEYQAFVFGIYYRLLRSIVTFKPSAEDAYLRGLWGADGQDFLTRCTQLSDVLYRSRMATRTQILHMLATMLNARQKKFTKSAKRGLLGVLGQISILSKPLVETTDIPLEICRFVVIDRPVLDLVGDSDGELYAGSGGGYEFMPSSGPTVQVRSQQPSGKWTLLAKMAALFEDSTEPSTVVMLARCDEIPCAWFSPAAADHAFLSAAYLAPRHRNENDAIFEIQEDVFEMTDSEWKRGVILNAEEQEGPLRIGIVYSRQCPALRYAAVGILTEIRQEISIATDDIDAAYGRIQPPGMVVC